MPVLAFAAASAVLQLVTQLLGSLHTCLCAGGTQQTGTTMAGRTQEKVAQASLLCTRSLCLDRPTADDGTW